MAEFKPPCGCPDFSKHLSTCRLVLPAAISALPEQLPVGVVVESLHLRGIGNVYLSDVGGIRGMTPDEARGLAKALLLKAEEAGREEDLDAAA